MIEGRASVRPSLPGSRTSGVLLHVTSLPSAYGIGDLGPAAFRWVDRNDMLADDAFERLRDLTKRSGRLQGGC